MKKFVYLVATLFLFSSNFSYANSNEACTDGSKFLVLQVGCRVFSKGLSPDNNYVDDQLVKISRKRMLCRSWHVSIH